MGPGVGRRVSAATPKLAATPFLVAPALLPGPFLAATPFLAGTAFSAGTAFLAAAARLGAAALLAGTPATAVGVFVSVAVAVSSGGAASTGGLALTARVALTGGVALAVRVALTGDVALAVRVALTGDVALTAGAALLGGVALTAGLAFLTAAAFAFATAGAGADEARRPATFFAGDDPRGAVVLVAALRARPVGAVGGGDFFGWREEPAVWSSATSPSWCRIESRPNRFARQFSSSAEPRCRRRLIFSLDAKEPAISASADHDATIPTDLYGRLASTVATGRRRLGRPLTLAEKVLFNHLSDPEAQELERGHSYAEFLPDRVAMQDATAQMALLQFMTADLPRVQVPTTIHCDHLILARTGAAADLVAANDVNAEVYDFLRTASARYGVGFWEPGSGIIHQVVLEHYAFPGGMLIGTDSHTPNAGGLGMVAIGVGGAEAVDVLTGGTFGIRWPRLIGVRLDGALSGWASPKDVILRVAQLLTVKGGTGAIVEYFGPGTAKISATGKATICNMGAELGATTSVFPFDDRIADYLEATGRQALADAAVGVGADLRADDEVEADPDRFFDQIIHVDLSALEPYVVGPHTPDLARTVSELGSEAAAKGWPLHLSQACVGSCTNSSYEDIGRAASVARQATARGLRTRTPLLVTPGSEQVRATVERDGLLADLEAVGATVLANACGPCIGQWSRSDMADGEANSIITSFNRNFPKRNDGNAQTLAFIASPETTVAYALAGTLDFNPVTDTIDGVRLTEPEGEELPERGFADSVSGYVAPAAGTQPDVVIRPDSTRLQRLEPFPAWDGSDFVRLPILIKARGKCTTDHISAAGKWLRYRGHLTNITRNLWLSAMNEFTGEAGTTRCPVHGEVEPIPDAAFHCRDAGVTWVAIGDENYGEGSSREHAAMEPRFVGARAVIVRSFARIHETNLKKQGVLPLVFADPATYDEIVEGDLVSVLGLADLAPERPVSCVLHHPDGTTVNFFCTHSLSPEHIEWFAAGSALNLIRRRFYAD